MGAGTVFVGRRRVERLEAGGDGTKAERSPAFGWANAFEVPAAGSATLRYVPSVSRWLLVAVQAAMWLALIWLATRTGPAGPAARPRAAVAPTLIDLGDAQPSGGRAANRPALLAVTPWWCRSGPPAPVVRCRQSLPAARGRPAPAVRCRIVAEASASSGPDRGPAPDELRRPLGTRASGAFARPHRGRAMNAIARLVPLVALRRPHRRRGLLRPGCRRPRPWTSARSPCHPCRWSRPGRRCRRRGSAPACPPGRPATGNGFVSVLNAGDTPIEGSLTAYSTDGQTAVAPLVIKERSRVDVRLGDLMVAPWAAAVVELLGAEGVVEQSVIGPTGRSTSACANSAGSTWYLADGATTVDATLGILLFNPFPDDAIVDVSFSTSEGTRTPQATQGYVVPGTSVRLLQLNEIVRAGTHDLDDGRGPQRPGRRRPGAGLPGGRQAGPVGRGRVARAGRAVVVRLGRKGDQAAERITIFNPGDSDAEVDVAFYPADPSTAPPPTRSAHGAPRAPRPRSTWPPPTRCRSVSTASWCCRRRVARVVAERVLEVQGDAARNVTIQPGSPLTATTWTFVTGAPDGAEALVVANATGEATTASVLALGPAGFTVVPGLEDMAIPAAGLVRIDLDERGLAGVPLVVEGALEVVAERVVGAPVGQPGISISRGIPYLGA